MSSLGQIMCIWSYALANVSPFANLIGAVMPMVMQIAANHKMVPAAECTQLAILTWGRKGVRPLFLSDAIR